MSSDIKKTLLNFIGISNSTNLKSKSFEAFMSLSNDAMLVLLDDEIVSANYQALDLFQVSIEKLAGNNFCSYLKAHDELIFRKWITQERTDFLKYYLRISSSVQKLVKIKMKSFEDEGKLYHLLVLQPLDMYQAQLNETLVWRNRYQLFADLSNQLFFEWDFINHSCEWGKHINSFFGGRLSIDDEFEDLYPIVHPNHEEDLLDAVRASLFSTQKLDIEVLLEIESEEYQWFRIIGDKHELANKVNKLIGVIIHIDEAKKNANALAESESIFQSLLGNMREVFFRTDKEGNIILLNQSATNLFECESLDEIVGRPVEEIYFNNEDRKELIKQLDDLGRLDAYELALITKLGNKIIVKVSVRYYYDVAGHIAGTEGIFYDITESKQIELERIKLLDEFRNTLSSANIHVYRYKRDLSGNYVYSFSEGKFPIVEGKTTKDVLNKTFDEVYGKEMEQEEKNAIEMAFQGKTVSFIAQWDNEYYQSDISPFSIVDDNVEEVIGVIYNINEIIEAEKALVESEERYKTLVENAQDGIVIVKDAKFVFVNQTTVKLLGYDSKNEIIGLPISEIIDPQYADEIIGNHESRMQGDSITRIYETKLISKDGRIIPVEINNNLIQYEGDRAGLTFIRDLTQRKKDKDEVLRLYQQNEALLELFPMMYLVTNRSGEIINLNIPESVGLDYLNRYIKIGENFKKLPISDKNAEKISYYHMKAFETGQMQRFSLKQIVVKHVLHLEFRIIRLSDHEALTTIDDITDRLEYQKRLIIAKEKAEESDRLKSAFLANMSHEIRTPMNAILGFTEMLSYPDIDDDERLEFVDIIKRRSYDLLHIINDIIDVSKMEAGLMNFNIEATSVNAIIKDVISSFRSDPKVRDGHLNLVYNLGLKDGHDIAMVDPVRLKQVFINLLNNAIKFTESGQVEISYVKDGDDLKFEVEDTGIGIKEASKGIIFDRFMQAEMDKNRNYGGTGLGLTISKNIVEKLGGSISFTSEYGKGSLFYFNIPYVGATEYKKFEQENLPTDILTAKNILIAEDEDTNYLVISSILLMYKVNCTRAKDGIEAIQLVQERDDFDLILMDIRMPRLNGIEATTEITRISNIPVIMQTAYAFDKDINQALEAGARDFVAKPISATNLVSKLIKHLQ